MKYDPLNDGKSLVEYIQHMGSDEMVVNAARVSFNADIIRYLDMTESLRNQSQYEQQEKDIKLINYLAKHKHSSPFQHNSVTLHVSCPLFVYAQWRRHRTFNYTQINEVSRRYTSEGIEFYYPRQWREQENHFSNKQGSGGFLPPNLNQDVGERYRDFVEYALETYDYLIDASVAREMARMVLPQSMYTRFYCTMDLWNLYHYWTLRKDPHAQEEIRVYAEAIDNIATELYPISWEALRNG